MVEGVTGAADGGCDKVTMAGIGDTVLTVGEGDICGTESVEIVAGCTIVLPVKADNGTSNN